MNKNRDKLIEYLLLSIIFAFVIVNISECQRGLMIILLEYNDNFIVYINAFFMGILILSLGGIIVGAMIDRVDVKKMINPFFIIIIILNIVGGLFFRFIENGEKVQLIAAIISGLIAITVLKTVIELLPKIVTKEKFIYFNGGIVLAVVIATRLVLSFSLTINVWEFNILGSIVIYLLCIWIVKDVEDEVIHTEVNASVGRSIVVAFKTIYRDRTLLKAYLSIIYSTVAGVTVAKYIIEYVIQKHRETSYHMRVDSMMGFVIVGVVILVLILFRGKKSRDILNRFVIIIPITIVIFCFNDVFNENVKEEMLWIISLIIVSITVVIEIHLKTYINENYERNMNGKLLAIKNALRNLTSAVIIAFQIFERRFLIIIDYDKATFIGALTMIVVFLAISGVFIKKKNIED